jgi:hypothetical protein
VIPADYRPIGHATGTLSEHTRVGGFMTAESQVGAGWVCLWLTMSTVGGRLIGHAMGAV